MAERRRLGSAKNVASERAQCRPLSYHTGPSEPQLTSSGRATRAEWLSSTHGTKCHDVTAKHTEFRRQRPDTHTEDIATRHATCGLQHQKRPYPPKPWAAVRACAVTLNTKLRVCRRGVISRKEMVRSASARSTEECVQCGPRSEFGVKEVAHENSGREEEGDRPGSLG